MYSDITFARVYGGLPEVLLAAGVQAEPTYGFYLNGFLFDQWKGYAQDKSHTPNEHVGELYRRVQCLNEASEGCNRTEYYQDTQPQECISITQKQLEMFRRDFDQVDVDQSGVIDAQEIAYLLKMQLGRKPTDEEVNCVVTSFDADGDGGIDFDEYMNWMLGEGWELQDGEPEPVSCESWSFKAGTRKSGRKTLTLYADRMAVYQYIRPATKSSAQLADRRIGFIKEESMAALVPMWTHAALGIDSKLPMRASAEEINAKQINFKLESTDDLLHISRPSHISLVDFTTGDKVKLKGTRKGFAAVCKHLLKK